MKKMLSILALLSILVPMSVCAKTIQASSRSVTRTVNTGAFSGLSTATSIDIQYSQDDVRSVSVTAPDNIIDLVDVAVKDGMLTVSYKSGTSISFNNGQSVKVCVSAPNVTKFCTTSSGDIDIVSALRCDGSVELLTKSSGDIDAKAIYCATLNAEVLSSGDIEVDKVVCTNLNAASKSSGDIEIKGITAGHVKAAASSSGDVDLSGTCTSAEYRSNSSGDVKAKNLIAVDVDAASNSSGSVYCTATGNAKTRKGSSGDVEVYRKN